MLITLSGLDGAGKSTLAEALKARFETDGVAVVIFHMNKQVGLYAYVRTLRDCLLRATRLENGSPQSLAAPKEDPAGWRASLSRIRHRIIWNKELRRWVDLCDLATFMVYRFYVEKVRGQVLIMDRYFYDRVTDIADGHRWGYHRWFLGITPVPDLAVFVEVPPEEAFARKGEYSVGSMTRRRAIYREVFKWVPGGVVLCNDDLQRAASDLHRLAGERRGRICPSTLASER